MVGGVQILFFIYMWKEIDLQVLGKVEEYDKDLGLGRRVLGFKFVLEYLQQGDRFFRLIAIGIFYGILDFLCKVDRDESVILERGFFR